MIKNITCIAFLISYTITAQTFNTAKLDSLFNLLDTHNQGMGSISIYKKGKEIYKNSIGYLDLENKVKANSETKYRIGSITKTFTATIIMQLVEEKKLKLETLLSDYFPKVSNSDKITIEHMLRHRSGLFNLTEDEDFMTWMVVSNTRKQMIDRLLKKGPKFQPDEKTAYSNTNYLLLSYIAEEIEGKTYAEILESKIIKPLHLKRTAYGKKINTNNNEAISYVMNDDKWVKIEKHTDMSVPIGAGAIVSTPTEVNIFYNSLFSEKLVSKTSLEKMMDTSTGMGIGLGGETFFNKQAYGHNGGIDGFQSLTMYLPEEEIVVSYIGNGVVMSPNNCIVNVLKSYYDQDYKLPVFRAPLEFTTGELDVYLGVYVSESFPFQITFTKDNTTLIASAKDGPTFPLVGYQKNGFKSDRAGATANFDPGNNTMILELNGNEVYFKRK
ncbi:CubicO group peptidase, beta-lactamase class C family [Aquimarina amphilecti]|uniref:CubicO group peptidase, beta-lactamase class C family n=1 Tax=Aquimarina amphilecti TaxID=1038014 RepID=A0A1H7VWU9_AQUAM|nr:serine hydrolase domain-containing protein [Aquimarina amphilecti]SEM13369.1 CubicO group peptidase, beta-lactamase class C family [Aquimarina amphilecti]